MAEIESINPAQRARGAKLPTPLPREVRELAVEALEQIHGLAEAASLLQDDDTSPERRAAARHILRRIVSLADEVLFPLVRTGSVANLYDDGDFENMRILVQEPLRG